MTTYHPFGAKTYNLGTSIGSTDITILLSSFTEPVTDVPYTMVLLNTDIAYGTIAPKTTSSEFISFTGITQNANGTATLTGVTRGLAKKYPFTTNAAYKLPHSGQTQFIISDVPQVFEKYITLENTETITGKKTFPGGGNAAAPVSGASYTAPTDDLEYASKKYVDSVAIAGAPDASLTVKGIVEVATAAEINSGATVGGTGASVVVRPDQFLLSNIGIAAGGDNTDIAVGSGNKFVTQTGLQKQIESYAASATGNDTYVITLLPVPTSYVNGMTVRFKADVGNTGAATLNVNTLGAITIKKSHDQDLQTGDIEANQIVTVTYNSTGPIFEMISQLAISPVVDVQTFSVSGAGSWTKPTGAKIVEVHLFGAGAGGGSGARNVTASSAQAGSGGGAGSYAYKKFQAGALGTTEAVSVGAKGTGGVARTGSNQNGANGVAGGATSFGTTVLLRAPGGTNGSGGGIAQPGGAGGVIGNGEITQAGGAGGAEVDDQPGAVGVSTDNLISPRGGGAGGGASGSNAGGVGGGFTTNYVQAGGATNTNGNSNAATYLIGGTGGGGGAGAVSATAAGNGGSPGGGGGGGGGGTSTSGAGGDGSDGLIVVITYF